MNYPTRARRSWPALKTDLTWGITAGLVGAACLCVIAANPVLFIFLLALMTYTSQRSGVATSFFVPETVGIGLRVLWVFPLYLAAGMVGGSLIGLCRPLARWRFGATVLGMAAGTILYWAMGPVVAAFTDMQAFSLEHLLISVGLGSFVGGTVAFREWEPPGS